MWSRLIRAFKLYNNRIFQSTQIAFKNIYYRRYSTLQNCIKVIKRKYSFPNPKNALFSRLHEDLSKPVPLLTFSEMIEYSRSTQKLSQNNTTKNESHSIEPAKYVCTQLKLLIARIIVDFDKMPYCVADNKRVNDIMKSYIDSYSEIKSIGNIKCIKSKNEFHKLLEKYLEDWTQVSLG